MNFNPKCEHCVKNKILFDEKRQKLREASRLYYTQNREAVIVRNMKNYYRKRKI